MKIIDELQKKIDDVNKEYQTKLKELDNASNAIKKLPQEILNLDDCWYVSNDTYFNKVIIGFSSEESIKALKMLGVQGFKTKFWGQYGEPDRWVWDDGKLEIDGTVFEFVGGKAHKPPTCTIEEYEVPAKPAEKRLRAVCNETGEVV